MNIDKTSQQDILPKTIIEFVNAFMRSVNTARLYSKGHELHKKNIEQLYMKLLDAFAEHDFLFLGCSRDSFFFEGVFFEAGDAGQKKFLEFAHSLRISSFLFDKDISPEEIEVFIEFLSSAKQGEGEEVSMALGREHIGHAKIGLLDYSVFSTVKAVAAELSHGSGDEWLWRQLIVKPATAGTFSVDSEGAKKLGRLAEDIEELKNTLLKMDAKMVESQTGTSAAQRGILLGNFIQNLGDTLASVDVEKRKGFALQVGGILNSFEPGVKIQILGSLAPGSGEEESSDVIREIIQAMPNEDLVDLLKDALREAGTGSMCFNNLFNRALSKYKEPGLLLKLVHRSMEEATAEGKAGDLQHLQFLEQLIIQREETDALNEEYFREIEALATSIQMKEPMAEEEEMKNLKQTLSPEFLAEAKARLIIGLMGQHVSGQDASVMESLLENLRDILGKLLEYNNLYTTGELMREVYLLLGSYTEDDSLKKAVSRMLTAGEVGRVFEYSLGMCRTFGPEETKVLDALCHIYPEKAGNYLLDILLKEGVDGPRVKWLYMTLASLGSRISMVLTRRFRGAPDEALPRLLDLAALSHDKSLSSSVEQFLDHKSHEVQLGAVNALGKIGADHSVDRLVEIVSKKSWVKTKKMKQIQAAAARSLADIGTRNAIVALQRVAEEGSDELKKLCRELLPSRQGEIK
jgi:hypothetical protein